MALADIPVALIQRCQRGEPGAHDALFEALHDDLYRWIFSLVRSPDDAEEILQDCCVRIFRHIERLQDPRKFPGWASRLVVNQVNTWRVQAKRRQAEQLDETFEPEPEHLPLHGRAPASPRQAASRAEVLERVNLAVAELPPRQRTAVLLFDVEGWSIREIAESLDCSEGAVKFNIFQGRRKLRSLLGEYVAADGKPALDLTGDD